MTLSEILNHRRAIRHYDPDKPLDSNVVKQCLQESTLAPTSSNMQLWECYHVTDAAVLKQLAHACLNQQSARTAQQMVVFVVRPDLYRSRAAANLVFERENIKRNSPREKWESRIKRRELYYGKLMPFQYFRFLGLAGLFRKLLAQAIGLFRPIVRQVSESEVSTVAHKSCALAVQTFMLAMSEKGYDTCPLEGFDSRLVKRALHLPGGCGINMVITCGVRLPDGVWGDRFRVPFEEVYHHV